MTTERLRRAKTSRAVVEHLQRRILDGTLRPGDRIDVDATAEALGISAAPVREALVLLERDGVASARLHRSTYVEHFDARTLRADFHALGLLSGVTVARMANRRDPEAIAEMHRIVGELRETPDGAEGRRRDLVRELLRHQHRCGATPRLRAQLRAFGGFLEMAALLADRRPHAEIVEAQARVVEAVEAGDERLASQRRLEDARAAAEEVIGELLRRGVLADDGRA